MELIWKEINALRLISNEQAQVRVAGHLPTPDGRTPSEVLSCRADVIVESTSFEQDEIQLKGRVEVTVNALDGDRRAFAFESKAGFEHSIRSEGAAPGMSAEAFSCIQSISAAPSESGVDFEANVDIDVSVTSSVPIKVTSGISGVDDLEIKTVELTQSRKVEHGSAVLRLREEIAADGAAEVISSEGQIMVRDIALEQGAASVSGVITVTAVIADSDGKLSQINRMIPFRERVAVDSLNDDMFCDAKLNSLYLRALGEDFALISMEAEVAFRIFGVEKDELILPVDAFSPSIGFDCLTERIGLLDFKGMLSDQTTIKETIMLPDNAADIESPLFITVRPIVTETDESTVNGILSTNAVYMSTAGRIYTFTEDVPFSVQTGNSVRANMPVVTPSCVGFVTGMGERSIQVQYSLILNTVLYDRIETEIAAGLAEREIKPNGSGIVICFASGGESFFDIAKRYSVPCSSVKALNPDIGEPFRDGDKLILMT